MIPQVASQLVAWSTTFRDVLVANPGLYFYESGDLAPLTAATNLFLNAQLAVANPEARSGALILARNNAQTAYYEVARPMYDAVQSNPQITDENKALAGVHVSDNTPTPAPVPTVAPSVTITNVGGNTVKVILRDENVQKRGKPPQVKSAAVYYWVGEEMPDQNTPWLTFANTGRTMFNMEFPSTLPKGTQVWVIAAWMNGRGQFGPSPTPQSALLLGQSTFQSGNLKLAA